MKKWRNKITGEISEFMVHKRIEDSEDGNPVYAPFDGHIEEWQDYEEPKTFWAISWAGEPEEYDAKNTPEELRNMAKQIGNYFDTREEAEKAVEKLKAWKRLKDKGFRFAGWEDLTKPYKAHTFTRQYESWANEGIEKVREKAKRKGLLLDETDWEIPMKNIRAIVKGENE